MIESISAFDRGLHYGDGLFETIAVFNSKPCLWQRHMNRLQAGCSRLCIPAPDTDELSKEVQSIIAGCERAVLKLIITRGNGQRGYAVPEDIRVNRILYLSEWPHALLARADAGVRLRFCATKVSINPSLAGIKHLNRLEQVLARNEWRDESILEGVMLDARNRVVEGTMSNLFIEKNGRLLTPDLSESGVAGVLRGLVLDVAEEMEQPVLKEHIKQDDLLQADGCYITNSLLGVRKVAFLGKHKFNDTAIVNPVMQVAAARVFES